MSSSSVRYYCMILSSHFCCVPNITNLFYEMLSQLKRTEGRFNFLCHWNYIEGLSVIYSLSAELYWLTLPELCRHHDSFNQSSIRYFYFTELNKLIQWYTQLCNYSSWHLKKRKERKVDHAGVWPHTHTHSLTYECTACSPGSTSRIIEMLSPGCKAVDGNAALTVPKHNSPRLSLPQPHHPSCRSQSLPLVANTHFVPPGKGNCVLLSVQKLISFEATLVRSEVIRMWAVMQIKAVYFSQY